METDIAWLAGIIDGEGSFSLAKQCRSPGYSSTLFIYNTSLPMIEKAESVIQDLGASVARIKPRIGLGLGRKPVFGLQICSDLTIVILAVLPYLATEKKQFAEEILTLHAMRVRGSKWTDEAIALAVSIRSRCMPRAITY